MAFLYATTISVKTWGWFNHEETYDTPYQDSIKTNVSPDHYKTDETSSVLLKSSPLRLSTTHYSIKFTFTVTLLKIQQGPSLASEYGITLFFLNYEISTLLLTCSVFINKQIIKSLQWIKE